MKLKKSIYIMFNVLILFTLVVGAALAEDGQLFRRNVSKTPANETEKSALYMMDFYVPAQKSTGEPYTEGLEYYLPDNVPAEDYFGRLYAKPLISVYIDDIGEHELGGHGNEIMTGVVFGAFDAFVSYSLDDGTSWRNENLSRSADLSSFTLSNGEAFPGMVHGLVHQVAEDKILLVWASKYCQSGFPLYSWDLVEEEARLTDLEETYGKNAMYLYDLFGVKGNQGSVDFTEQGFPEVGEIPYSCVWTARGKLLPGDDPKTGDFVEASHIVWTAPERITSAVRDANLPAVDCAKNSGCALTWQEDPEGLRPGKGLGPGEGWSGAIANSKTDIWYSYITFADFDLVYDDDAETPTAMLIEEYEALKGTEMDRPKPYVPMAMPVRLTDNDMCKGVNETDPYCWIDFDTIDTWDHTNVAENLDSLEQSTDSDFCTDTLDWTNPGGTTLPICITEDGRYMFGRVGSTRVRMILKPYTPPGAPDHDEDGVPDASAWLSLAAEETKALGITACEPEDPDCPTDPVDIGKNMWYHSFDYAKPYNLHVNPAIDEDINPVLDEDDPYVVRQGGMINQPAVCSPWFITYENLNPDIVCNENDFFGIMTDEITGYEYYLTEIARRFALTLNNISNITDPAEGGSGLAGIMIFKQGIIWQGGPADIMLRRLIVPEDFDPTVDNPFAYKNMECVDNGDPYSQHDWLYTDGSNPNYLEGLCMENAINISGTTIKECTEGSGNDTCAATFPVADDGSIYDPPDGFPKVLEWRSCDGVTAIDGCDNANDPGGDLDDQSWENPFEVAKGHRGFVYGDIVMMMYAWSPNWKANSVGNDHFNLYQRRSFDGGATWTTAPSNLPGWEDDPADGTGVNALEFYYGETIGDYTPIIWNYAPGDFEQARNLSLLIGNQVTVLDPRYSPGGGLKQYSTIRTDWLTENIGEPAQELPYFDDVAIDPSKYIMIYETGDNTVDFETSAATPLDLFYSRATNYGDSFEWFDYINDENDDILVEPRFPWLENQLDDLSGEASVVLNPGGTFAYQVWNQWKQEIAEDGTELIYDSDSIFRRLLWLPDDSDVELPPVATILYHSHMAALYKNNTELVFAGSARDFDKLGDREIVAFEWRSDRDGLLGNNQILKIMVTDLSLGPHKISFRAQDAEGNWSKPVITYLLVGDQFFTTGVPIIVK